MRIEKRGKHYRVQIQENGVRHSFTFTYKPSRSEVYERLTRLAPTAEKGTLFDFIFKYIDMKSNILSPATIKGYRSIVKAMDKSFGYTQLYKLDQPTIQKYVNVHSLTHTAKTTINMFSLVNVVLKTFRPDFTVNISLPKKIKKEPYIPTMQDVKLILKESFDTVYFVPLLLAVFGLRRGEIIALTMEDIQDDYICVNKSLVLDINKKWIKKSTKTYTDRIVYMPPQLIELIRQKGLYKGSPDSIPHYLYRLEKRLNLKTFSMHKLRHFYASVCHFFNMPDSYIQKQGGWASDTVMKGVYTHVFENERKQITENINYRIMENIFDNAPQMHQELIKIKKPL